MPLYEYRCDACGHRFEQIQKFSDPAVEVCPSCGERSVQKLLSSPAIQFKGSGFYITDYARKGTAAAETASKAADSEKSEKKETKDKSSDTTSSTESKSSTDTAPAAKKP